MAYIENLQTVANFKLPELKLNYMRMLTFWNEIFMPNVVYSCGALIHNNGLVFPYAMSDITSGIVTLGIKDIVAMME